MPEIKIIRPHFPKGYVDHPTSILTWDYVVERLSNSKNYWLCSVRPDGRPHSVPRWGVLIHDKFYYDGSPETVHARNIIQNPFISLHLENGDQALIAEGTTRPSEKPNPELAALLSKTFCAKYEKFGYAPKPDQWDEGGLFVFSAVKVLAWTVFFEDPTKFLLTW